MDRRQISSGSASDDRGRARDQIVAAMMEAAHEHRGRQYCLDLVGAHSLEVSPDVCVALRPGS